VVFEHCWSNPFKSHDLSELRATLELVAVSQVQGERRAEQIAFHRCVRDYETDPWVMMDSSCGGVGPPQKLRVVCLDREHGVSFTFG
jgi:hypothetical protein